MATDLADLELTFPIQFLDHLANVHRISKVAGFSVQNRVLREDPSNTVKHGFPTAMHGHFLSLASAHHRSIAVLPKGSGCV
jgi:hypothetical protein